MPSKISKQGSKRKLVLCICGMAGSGKSTVAKRLAEHYGLKYYSGGDALKAVAAEMGYKPTEKGWWETSEAIGFFQERLNNPEIDRKVDEKQVKWAKEGNVVFDSWAMPWLLKEGFKVWLEASEEVRAQRIAKRDGLSIEKALESLREKESKTQEIYKKLYGFNLGEDFIPFHLILDVNQLNEYEVFGAVCLTIDNLLLRKKKNNVFLQNHEFKRAYTKVSKN